MDGTAQNIYANYYYIRIKHIYFESEKYQYLLVP